MSKIVAVKLEFDGRVLAEGQLTVQDVETALADVPKARWCEAIVTRPDGARVRPYRFVEVDPAFFPRTKDGKSYI